MKKSSPERETETAKLQAYLADLPDGEVLSWMRIEADTDINMRQGDSGRNDVRAALRRLRRPYEAVRGEGLRLSSPDNAVTIVRSRFVRIDRAVRSADKVQQQLTERHLDRMSQDDQRAMIVTAGFFGAIRAMVGESKTKILK